MRMASYSAQLCSVTPDIIVHICGITHIFPTRYNASVFIALQWSPWGHNRMGPDYKMACSLYNVPLGCLVGNVIGLGDDHTKSSFSNAAEHHTHTQLHHHYAPITQGLSYESPGGGGRWRWRTDWDKIQSTSSKQKSDIIRGYLYPAEGIWILFSV